MKVLNRLQHLTHKAVVKWSKARWNYKLTIGQQLKHTSPLTMDNMISVFNPPATKRYQERTLRAEVSSAKLQTMKYESYQDARAAQDSVITKVVGLRNNLAPDRMIMT